MAVARPSCSQATVLLAGQGHTADCDQELDTHPGDGAQERADMGHSASRRCATTQWARSGGAEHGRSPRPSQPRLHRDSRPLRKPAALRPKVCGGCNREGKSPAFWEGLLFNTPQTYSASFGQMYTRHLLPAEGGGNRLQGPWGRPGAPAL